MASGPVEFPQTLDALPPQRRVFVNRNLRLDQIRAVGFDMDYTICRYHKAPMEALAHQLTVEKLVQRGYPEEIRRLKHDVDFMVRGLTVDTETGVILKLDRYGHAGRAFRGRKRLSKGERRRLYRSSKLTFRPPRFVTADTLFSMPELCLYADLVEYLDSHPELDTSTQKLFTDIRESIDEAHRDESLKTIIKASLPRFVERDPLLGRTLHKLRSSGKKLFLLTNSYWDYTNHVMSYLLDGDMAEYASWRAYFEVIIVGSQKPGFFTRNAPFVELAADGTAIGERSVDRFERGKVYQGGSLRAFETALHIDGEQILYVGDHIYGDILRSKKASLWRTALVVEELEDEVARTLQHRTLIDELHAYEEERYVLDQQANIQRQQLIVLERQEPPAPSEYENLRRERDRTKQRLKAVVAAIDHLEQRIEAGFHPNWGMLFKESGSNSRFGEQVTDYACLYTSRVSNFSAYSSYQYFRGPRSLLPHEQLG